MILRRTFKMPWRYGLSGDTCEGDIRLQGTRLLSPICCGSPRRKVGKVLRTVSASPFIFDKTVACCRFRQMTVWLRVWMIQTLPCGVSRFRGQNTLLLCLHVRRSGLCCQPDPPVLPTGSVFRISKTLPEGLSTSAKGPFS